ncbi:MAG: DEAD/DEAH box helicase family protein [Bacteroidales bacterium]|nr:DEAD/DEAH box helicase family protein [Bacteroidales bacterium]
MLKTDVTWPESFRYQTNTEWEPVGFFSEALCNATSFDLMLGFFSSSAINVLSYGFASFIYNGGKMRMIINDILSSDDVSAISMAHDGNDLPFFDLKNLEQLSYTLNKRDRHFFECLAWLIRNDRIEIKIVRMVNGSGIAHTKCGTFSDGINRIGFEGSVNFSLSAFMHNKESLGVYCDWNGPADVGRINGIQKSFDRAFNGLDKDIEFVQAVDLKGYTHSQFKSKGLDELLDDELDLIENAEKQDIPETIKAALNQTKIKVERAIEKIKGVEQAKESEPRFPYPAGPRPYQQQAFESWKENQQGLFAMATGTGKTLTSLNCLLEIYKRKGYYKAIILVPTLTLVDQWEEECKKFHFGHIVKVYSKNKEWKSELDAIRLQEDFNFSDKEPSYIIIATYASFARDSIFKDLISISNKINKKLLLIADEAHNMGSPRILNRLSGVKYKRRIGLSATPERQFDDMGNNALRKFFGCEDLEGYTFEFSMQEAIDKGYLCRYFYYPHLVRLTDEEMSEYMKISIQLAKFYNYDNDSFPGSGDILMRLLLKRKRIVHKAKNKESIFESIIRDWYNAKGSLKYTLVYVPEGSRPDDESADLYDSEESIPGDDYTDSLIDTYTNLVQAISPTTTVKKFISGTGERKQILEDFATGKLEVLTSMKCLDEGVDVPRSELAIFCANTGNPRQFIQRRGRILRNHPDKKRAVIHDLVVVPEISSVSENFNMERSLLASELKRVRDFALMSENADFAYEELKSVLDYYDLSLF